ncbi:MAG: amidase, partial [Dehalococcoidia bacterium]
EALKYRDRDPGRRPSRQEDPFNAIVRRCTLKGASSGKLAGKRFGLKNNICVAGMPMSCGSLVLEGYVPESDATIVTRLLDAGAEVVATLNLDNFAFSGAGDTSAQGATLNPHNTGYLAGGSSGGSASALYYDDIDITIGGDQGGSIRIPASWCGVVGLKPTHGLVPYTGIVGIDNTFDHAGPMSRTVAESALTLEVIAGKDPLDPRQGEAPVQPYTEALGGGVNGLRIGVLTEGFDLEVSEPDVDAGVRKALEVFQELGAATTEVSIPDHMEAGGIVWGLVAEGATALLRSNGMGYHWEGLYNPGLVETLGKSRRAQANDFPPTVKLILLLGTYMAERYHGRLYAKAQNLRRVLRASYDRALGEVDLLAMPTTPMKAHRYEPDIDIKGLITHGWDMLSNTAPFDMTGHPAISIPCGKPNGLPVGLMLVGRRFDDATLFRFAHSFEQQVNWETL